MPRLLLAFCLLLFSACYSGYKAIYAGSAIKQPVVLTSRLDASTVSILPKLRADGYKAHLLFDNKTDSAYRITNLQVSLRKAFPKAKPPTNEKTALLTLNPGENAQLAYKFAGKSRLFPNKVAIEITGDLQQGNQTCTLVQTFYFKRYMYVNVGGI